MIVMMSLAVLVVMMTSDGHLGDVPDDNDHDDDGLDDFNHSCAGAPTNGGMV